MMIIRTLMILVVYIVGVAAWLRLRGHMTEQASGMLTLFCSVMLGCFVASVIVLTAQIVASAMTIVAFGFVSLLPAGIITVNLMNVLDRCVD